MQNSVIATPSDSRNIFLESDYRVFLKNFIKARSRKKNFWTQLSARTQIHRTYCSQVFSLKADFNSDQGMAIAEYFGFSELEKEFLLTQIQFNRAATQPLKKFWEKKLTHLKRESFRIQNQKVDSEIIESRDFSEFYSHFVYHIVYAALSLDGINTEAKLSHLKIDSKLLKEIVNRMIEMGFLARARNGILTYLKRNVHLPDTSPHLNSFLVQSRFEAIRRQALSRFGSPDENIYFSGVYSFNLAEYEKIRSLVSDLIFQSRNYAKPGQPNTELAVLNVDFFRYL